MSPSKCQNQVPDLNMLSFIKFSWSSKLKLMSFSSTLPDYPWSENTSGAKGGATKHHSLTTKLQYPICLALLLGCSTENQPSLLLKQQGNISSTQVHSRSSDSTQLQNYRIIESLRLQNTCKVLSCVIFFQLPSGYQWIGVDAIQLGYWSHHLFRRRSPNSYGTLLRCFHSF